MIRVADYVAQKLVEHGVGHVFLITGGGAMHLNDAIGRCEGLRYVCCHHEQACAIAAEGYARVTGQIGVANVTTGPGGTNALTGVLGQWLDSIPALIVSGQVRTETTAGSTGLGLRQLGDQEANIVEIVRSITKYAVMVTDPQSIRYHLEKALHLARAGRPTIPPRTRRRGTGARWRGTWRRCWRASARRSGRCSWPAMASGWPAPSPCCAP